MGKTLHEMGIREALPVGHICVKESVFPFSRFMGVDPMLGPEMKSTGEVMGLDPVFGMAFGKAQLAAGQRLPREGRVFVSLKNSDKRPMIFIVKKLLDLGFDICATFGTARTLQMNGIPAEEIKKVSEGNPNVVDLIKEGSVQLIINTPSSRSPVIDEVDIRSNAVANNIPLVTTVSGASAAVNAMEILFKESIRVKALQDYHVPEDSSSS